MTTRDAVDREDRNKMEPTSQWGAPWTDDEERAISDALKSALPPEFVRQRKGAGGMKVDYLEGGAQLEIANAVFGPTNWSSRVLNIEMDYGRQDSVRCPLPPPPPPG